MLRLTLAVLAALAVTELPPDADYRPDQAWDGEDLRAICRSVAGVHIPVADMPSPAQAARLKGCNSEALLFGIGRPRDVVAARHCAILEAQRDDMDRAEGYSGYDNLLRIYANGVGVPRNPGLALRLACQPTDLSGDSLLLVLAQQRRGGPVDAIDPCGHTNSRGDAVCRLHDERIAAAARQADFARFSQGLTPTQRQAFRRLQAAAADYANAAAENEVNTLGSLRDFFFVDDRMERMAAFTALLDRLRDGRPPKATPNARRAAEAALQKANADALRWARAHKPAADDRGGETMTAEGEREAQSAWTVYRGAWLAFARATYPKASQDGLATYLARERRKLLADSPRHMG